MQWTTRSKSADFSVIRESGSERVSNNAVGIYFLQSNKFMYTCGSLGVRTRVVE